MVEFDYFLSQHCFFSTVQHYKFTLQSPSVTVITLHNKAPQGSLIVKPGVRFPEVP